MIRCVAAPYCVCGHAAQERAGWRTKRTIAAPLQLQHVPAAPKQQRLCSQGRARRDAVLRIGD